MSSTYVYKNQNISIVITKTHYQYCSLSQMTGEHQPVTKLPLCSPVCLPGQPPLVAGLYLAGTIEPCRDLRRVFSRNTASGWEEAWGVQSVS